MDVAEFDYDLPEHFIAQQPSEPRDAARLMVIDRKTGTIEHATFRDISRWITKDDLLILNNSKVIPARLDSDLGEVLLIQQTSANHWLAIGRKLKVGKHFKIFPRKYGLPPIDAEILQSKEDGQRVIRFYHDFDLKDYGVMPVPPYIQKGRPAELLDDDDEWYQTVYAEKNGSVAAPTAGLHFTPELLQQFNHAFITLHVGIGTFRPVKVEHVEDHDMHHERFSIPEGLVEKAQKSKRVVAVGTTTARVLESHPNLQTRGGTTNIFIYPPYPFKRVDALITNFHLPRSTLLMMVAAFMGHDLQRRAYAEAINNHYRFYSYGDAMLIL